MMLSLRKSMPHCNALIANAFRIWTETGEHTYRRKDGKAFERPGAGQLIFSDLGTIAVEASRGFSAYRWIRSELVRLGVPASEISASLPPARSRSRIFGRICAALCS